MVDDAIIAVLAEIKTGIGEITAELRGLNQRVNRNEGYTHHINKRLLEAEKNLSWVKGGVYVFIALSVFIFGLFKI